MLSRKDLERRKDIATTVVSLDIGPMNVLILRPNPHHPQPMPGEANTSKSTTRSPSTKASRGAGARPPSFKKRGGGQQLHPAPREGIAQEVNFGLEEVNGSMEPHTSC